MADPGPSRDRWLLGGMTAFVLIVGVSFAAALLRDRGGGRGGRSDSAAASSGAGAPRTAAEMRAELVAALLLDLERAVREGDRGRSKRIAAELVREGDGALPGVLEAFRRRDDWNLRIVLLDVLASVPTAAGIASLAEAYGGLKPQEVALKLEVVRRLLRAGGAASRESAALLLEKESDPKVREEVAALLALAGMTPEEARRLPARDREALEGKVADRQRVKESLKRVEAADVHSEAGFAAVRAILFEERAVAPALAAVQRLEERGDAAAVGALAERLRAPAGAGGDEVIRTNVLAALARMKGSEARMFLRGVVLGEEAALRRQAVDLIGAFGDRAMLPLLEQARAGAGDEALRQSIDQACVRIRARVAGEEGLRK